MFKIKTLNKISDAIYNELSTENYMISDNEPNPDAILVRSAKMHDMPIPNELKAIARAGAGTNNIPVEECSKKGIAVFYTPGANANAVSELVIGSMILCGRDIIGGIKWASTLEGTDVEKQVEAGKKQFIGAELRGKKLAVIGVGAIGANVVNAASNGLGMEVVGYDPYISVDSALKLTRSVNRAISVDDAISDADFITIHMPLTAKTESVINADLLSKMKNGVTILNFSRAGLVNKVDMKEALESGKVRKYATDFPDAEILKFPNTICIPHLGASTPESEENCAVMAASELRNFLECGQIHNSVNLPEIQLGQSEGNRILVIHANVPSMVNAISSVVSMSGVNINNMLNKSRKDIAVTVLELDIVDLSKLIHSISSLPNVYRVINFGQCN